MIILFINYYCGLSSSLVPSKQSVGHLAKESEREKQIVEIENSFDDRHWTDSAVISQANNGFVGILTFRPS